jgi:predicted DNA-binding transcriptional regulator AlpA
MSTEVIADAWLDLADIKQRAKISKSAFYKAIQDGRAPAPIKLSRRFARWPAWQIADWMADPLLWAERNRARTGTK